MSPKFLITYFIVIGTLFSQDPAYNWDNVKKNVNQLPDNPEKLLKKGNMEMDSGNILLAEEIFNKALLIDPSFAPAIKGLSKLSLHNAGSFFVASALITLALFSTSQIEIFFLKSCMACCPLSINTTDFAPRDKASRPKAPVPAKRSSV